MSFLSHLSLIPSFPTYTGPYKVGTQDVELQVSELSSLAPAPDPTISTISFRIFYPCSTPEKTSRHVHWLPSPQTQHLRAYARFLNASPRLAVFLSYLPIFRPIFYTTIPAIADAKLAKPPESVAKWPVMVFSHGLGGSRNAYSHITGSLASHGMVVIAPEHRDGSCPISYIHPADGSAPKIIPYKSFPHRHSDEVDEGRDEQLRIRLWELGLIHNALLKIDQGESLTNTIPVQPQASISGFTDSLDIHDPGKIAWSGHSFGAASVIQFIKSIYYPAPHIPSDQKRLYTRSPTSALKHQITSSTPIVLLDLWTQPLLSDATIWLWQHSLPAYIDENGSAPLAILSEAFFKWSSNLRETKAAVSAPPNSSIGLQPNIFYPVHSAHLSQSDFGLLFPCLTKKVFNAEDPERTMRLNVRAVLESLRRSGVKVADTSDVDMEVAAGESSSSEAIDAKQAFPLAQDHRILATDERVKGWVAVPLNDDTRSSDANGQTIDAKNPGEAMIEGEVMKSEL